MSELDRGTFDSFWDGLDEWITELEGDSTDSASDIPTGRTLDCSVISTVQ